MRINIDELDIGDDLAYYYEGELFTGEVVETDQNGHIIAFLTLVDGRGNGPEWLWFSDGRLKTETMVRDGRAVGVSREWHPNGQLAQESEFDAQGQMMSIRRWNEDGSPAPVQQRARLMNE